MTALPNVETYDIAEQYVDVTCIVVGVHPKAQSVMFSVVVGTFINPWATMLMRDKPLAFSVSWGISL